MSKSAKSQYCFQDNNALGKRYTNTCIKFRNFLLNIVYVDINIGDNYKENFIFDVHLRVTKNLNPLFLDRKLADKTKHEMTYTLWKECIVQKFYKHIWKEINFLYLNGKNVRQPKVLEVITKFLNEDENNYKEMRNTLSIYKNIFLYVYSKVFPEIYCSTEKRGFDLRSNFHIIFKTYKDKKQLESSLGKNPENYETIHNETNIYQQKPINVDDFNEVEEKEVKERVGKRKRNRRVVAKKHKQMKKQQRKHEESKVKEKDMRTRLTELNNGFKEINKIKKDSK